MGLAFEETAVDLLGDEPADVRVHSPASIEEQTEMRWHRRLPGEHMVETGHPRAIGMRALRWLGKLAGVAHQDQVGRRGGDGQHVRERQLARLVDHERVDCAGHGLSGEQPRGAGDDVDRAIRHSGFDVVVALGGLDRRVIDTTIVVGHLLNGTQPDVLLGCLFGDAQEQVGDHGMAVGGDATWKTRAAPSIRGRQPSFAAWSHITFAAARVSTTPKHRRGTLWAGRTEVFPLVTASGVSRTTGVRLLLSSPCPRCSMASRKGALVDVALVVATLVSGGVALAEVARAAFFSRRRRRFMSRMSSFDLTLSRLQSGAGLDLYVQVFSQPFWFPSRGGWRKLSDPTRLRPSVDDPDKPRVWQITREVLESWVGRTPRRSFKFFVTCEPSQRSEVFSLLCADATVGTGRGDEAGTGKRWRVWFLHPVVPVHAGADGPWEINHGFN